MGGTPAACEAATTNASSGHGTSVLLVFIAPSAAPRSSKTASASDEAIGANPASSSTLSTGLLSATQGTYTTAQFLLDLSQGARVSYSSYTPQHPPLLSLHTPPGTPFGVGPSSGDLAHALTGAGADVRPWSQVLKRAHGAPQILEPGLLASSIPSGAAYVGVTGANDENAVTAANRSGHIAALSLGSAATLPARTERAATAHRLVLADLPSGPMGYADLRVLTAARASGELLIVLPRVPPAPGDELLWVSLAGLGGGHTLTSQTTNQRGLVATTDLAPTILDHLALPVPAAMRGRQIALDGAFEGSRLRSFRARLLALYPRRLPTLACLLVAWALLALAVWLLPLGDSPSPRARAWVGRVGALALLWTPVAVLLPAALEPTRAVEVALLVLCCFALGALTDRLLPWPRAPLAPALVAIVALSVDALAGTQLLVRSLLGPNPALGVRFYGIGNELKSGLAVLVFAAVAAALYPLAPGGRRRAVVTMALAGIALAVVEGSARLGAGVGGVILVSAGTAVAVVLLLPGRLTRKRALIVLVSPLLGLVALAALDLLTAHGSGHYTGSVLHARSAGDIRDIIVRRYTAAYDELGHGAMPLATALALLLAFLGVRRRERLLAPVDCDPIWLAALAGGLAAGVVGALSEDSGPVLLVVAVFVLACLLGYLWSAPPERATRLRAERTPDTSRAARSRARTPPGALSR